MTPPPLPPVQRLDDAALHGWPLPSTDDQADKESRGRVLIVAGSREIPGAAILSAQAALRAGAGRVVLATAESVATAIAVAMPELRVVALPQTAKGGFDPSCASQLETLASEAGVLLIGPGMQDEDAACALAQALCGCCADVPTVLDAAAIGAVTRLPARNLPVLITPHAGEMAHLSGCSKESVLADPHAAARQAAQRWNAIVALKGARTFIARPDGRSWVHDGGNVGLATSGSGDVLAGLIAGLVARGAPLEQAAAWGVALHGRAGDRLAARIGSLGYLARELAAEVPALLDSMAPATLPSRARQSEPPVLTEVLTWPEAHTGP
jgi:ADP-dependent NAD(P)H-hydrate dehydratase